MNCAKTIYPSRKAARQAARRIPGRRFHAYRCPDCGQFHLTTAAAESRAYHRRQLRKEA